MVETGRKDWREDMVTAYPEIFHPQGDPPGAPGWPWVEDGWEDLLLRACRRIRRALLGGGSFRATQLKEKFGTLRFYFDANLAPPSIDVVREAIDLAEARSACTCEICGDEGRLRAGGWLKTLCDAHAGGRESFPRRDHDGLFVVQRMVDGRLRPVSHRMYDRGTDCFIEVPGDPE